jgi:hypothetical protein
MEMIVQMQTVEEIPDELLVTFVLQKTPAIIHCYNIVDLRGWIMAGNGFDHMTKIRFTPAQMKAVESQWSKLRRKKSKIFLDVLLEDEIISSPGAEIPTWNGKGKRPKYDIVISTSTPYQYMVAIHIMTSKNKDKIPAAVIANGAHHSSAVWNNIIHKSKWVIFLPSPGDEAVTAGTHYRAVDGDDKEVDSASDSAAILGDTIKAWEEDKLLTTSKFVKGRRSGSDTVWKLNLPNLINEIVKNFNYLNFAIPWLRHKDPYDILSTGGDILPIELWETLRGGSAHTVRRPGPYFYKLWTMIVEQIHYLIYNESAQY